MAKVELGCQSSKKKFNERAKYAQVGNGQIEGAFLKQMI